MLNIKVPVPHLPRVLVLQVITTMPGGTKKGSEKEEKDENGEESGWKK